MTPPPTTEPRPRRDHARHARVLLAHSTRALFKRGEGRPTTGKCSCRRGAIASSSSLTFNYRGESTFDSPRGTTSHTVALPSGRLKVNAAPGLRFGRRRTRGAVPMRGAVRSPVRWSCASQLGERRQSVEVSSGTPTEVTLLLEGNKEPPTHRSRHAASCAAQRTATPLSETINRHVLCVRRPPAAWRLSHNAL